jgi:hypothetical protein
MVVETCANMYKPSPNSEGFLGWSGTIMFLVANLWRNLPRVLRPLTSPVLSQGRKSAFGCLLRSRFYNVHLGFWWARLTLETYHLEKQSHQCHSYWMASVSWSWFNHDQNHSAIASKLGNPDRRENNSYCRKGYWIQERWVTIWRMIERIITSQPAE